jgi:hypothetical protein
VAYGGRKALQYRTPPAAVGHGGRDPAALDV